MSSITGTPAYSPYSNPFKTADRQIQGSSAAAKADVEATNADKQAAIAKIYDEARSSVTNHTAKSFLRGLTTEQLSVLQGASSLANPIDVSAISAQRICLRIATTLSISTMTASPTSARQNYSSFLPPIHRKR